MQVWDSAEKKFICGWSLWNNLPDPSWQKLHVHPTSQGSDRKLLLLPISCIPQSSWWFWWHPNSQPSQNPCSIRRTCRRLHCPDRRLVQGQSHGNLTSFTFALIRNSSLSKTREPDLRLFRTGLTNCVGNKIRTFFSC